MMSVLFAIWKLGTANLVLEDCLLHVAFDKSIIKILVTSYLVIPDVPGNFTYFLGML